MKPILVLAAAGALALGGCGGGSSSSSKQDDAKAQVCDARADISKQVDTLKGLTVSAATLDQIQTSLKAIDSDLKTIAGAAGDLKGDDKSQLQQANKEFVTQINNIASSLVKSTSLSQAQSQAKDALSQLSDAYQQTFAKFSCD
jgi:membrane-bound lytic murein transglycosylase B